MADLKKNGVYGSMERFFDHLSLPEWSDRSAPTIVRSIIDAICHPRRLVESPFFGSKVLSQFDLPWVEYEDPKITQPSTWLALHLDSGEVGEWRWHWKIPVVLSLLTNLLQEEQQRQWSIFGGVLFT